MTNIRNFFKYRLLVIKNVPIKQIAWVVYIVKKSWFQKLISCFDFLCLILFFCDHVFDDKCWAVLHRPTYIIPTFLLRRCRHLSIVRPSAFCQHQHWSHLSALARVCWCIASYRTHSIDLRACYTVLHCTIVSCTPVPVDITLHALIVDLHTC